MQLESCLVEKSEYPSVVRTANSMAAESDVNLASVLVMSWADQSDLLKVAMLAALKECQKVAMMDCKLVALTAVSSGCKLGSSVGCDEGCVEG